MPETPNARRVFSYAETLALLPEVKRLTDEARGRVEELERQATGSGDVDPRLESLVQSWAESIRDLGVEVKGLWLVDFDNGSGYYCWRHPEPTVQFYHSYEDGFGGRMPIQ